MSKDIHLAFELPNGVKLLVSGDLHELIKKYDVKAKDLWKVKPTTLKCNGAAVDTVTAALMKEAVSKFIQKCINEVRCTGADITIMRDFFKKEEIHAVQDISHFIDPCICPEGGCFPLIRVIEPGIAFKNLDVYISFDQLIKKIPNDQRKIFKQMMDEIIKQG